MPCLQKVAVKFPPDLESQFYLANLCFVFGNVFFINIFLYLQVMVRTLTCDVTLLISSFFIFQSMEEYEDGLARLAASGLQGGRRSSQVAP